MGDVTRILKDLGIPVTYNNGTCRSLRDILEDLSNYWDKLTADQKGYFCDIVEGDNKNEE